MAGILYEKRNRIAYVTLNNPEKANVLNDQVMVELRDAWKEVWEDKDVRVAVITGKGDRHFCAGHDLAPRPGQTEDERRREFVERIFWANSQNTSSDYKPIYGSVNEYPTGVDGRSAGHFPQIWKPVIGAINGWAVGAGFYMMLTTTDIRIASRENARFQYMLMNQGWLGSGPGAARLPRQIGHVDAMRILLMDEPFDAEEALRIRLINEVVPHEKLLERAEELATRIASLAPVAVRMMKEFLIRGADLPFDAAWQMSHLMQHLVMQLTTDPEEGRNAFNEKRERNFTGGLRVPGNTDGV